MWYVYFIELLQKDVGIYYYKSYLESPEFPHTTKSETKLHTIFLLNEIYDKFKIIIKKSIIRPHHEINPILDNISVYGILFISWPLCAVEGVS